MIRERGHWEGLVGYWINNRERWVTTVYSWNILRRRLAFHANFRCEHCGVYLGYRGDVHHRFGRGAGKRDDRIEFADGTRNLFYLCRECHSETAIERKSNLTITGESIKLAE
jgi:hypothetical protein